MITNPSLTHLSRGNDLIGSLACQVLYLPDQFIFVCVCNHSQVTKSCIIQLLCSTLSINNKSHDKITEDESCISKGIIPPFKVRGPFVQTHCIEKDLYMGAI